MSVSCPASDIWNRSQRHDDQLFNYRALADGQCDILLATSQVRARRAGRVGRQLAVDVEAVTYAASRLTLGCRFLASQRHGVSKKRAAAARCVRQRSRSKL